MYKQKPGISGCLDEYFKKGKALFCMPGHKGRYAPLNQLLHHNPDITETPFTDSLFTCCGSIAETEQAVAQLYGTKKSCLSAGGSTLCIQAMLMLLARPGDKILLARNCHASAVNACVMLHLTPVWLYPQPVDALGLAGGIRPEDVETALEKEPDIKAVFITSPDYFGILSPIQEISQICKAHGVALGVDNAHGAHLGLFGLHPIQNGADICCDSAHKTLPALTGGAFLHIANEQYVSQAKMAMSFFGSTSPSYLIMASLDLCAAYLRQQGKEDFIRLRQQVAELKDFAQSIGYFLPGGQCDPVRLSVGYTQKTKTSFYEILCEYGIEPEYCSSQWSVFLPSPFHTQKEFSALRQALNAFSRIAGPCEPQESLPLPQQAIDIRQARLAESIYIPLSQSQGRIAAAAQIFCPPGICPCMPGEIITKDCINILKNYGISHINVVK